jgi:hypothetical protein
MVGRRVGTCLPCKVVTRRKRLLESSPQSRTQLRRLRYPAFIVTVKGESWKELDLTKLPAFGVSSGLSCIAPA